MQRIAPASPLKTYRGLERSGEEIDLVSIRIENAGVTLTPEPVSRSLLALEACTRDRGV
jgi:hypothetical protein